MSIGGGDGTQAVNVVIYKGNIRGDDITRQVGNVVTPTF